MQFIDLKTPHQRYKAEIEGRMNAVLEHGAFIMGPEIAEVEKQLASYVGVKHAITTSSGTHSLEIALRALGIGPGDEVITVAFTWISSAEVVPLVGAKPVFVDIERVGFNIDVSKIEKAITPRTKAIMPVSLFGQMPDYAAVNAIGKQHGIPVIEDGAQSFGATQNGKRSCGVTLIGSTSFFPAKPLGCYGDGGALFTDDDALAGKMREIRVHGQAGRYRHTRVGVGGRMDSIQCAVVLAKLERFDWEIRQRIEIGAHYDALLSPLVRTLKLRPDRTSVYAQYTVRVADRAGFERTLKARGIPTAVHYPLSLHQQPAYAAGYAGQSFPVSERLAQEVISLPMHADLDERTQQRIVEAVREFAPARARSAG